MIEACLVQSDCGASLRLQIVGKIDRCGQIACVEPCTQCTPFARVCAGRSFADWVG